MPECEKITFVAKHASVMLEYFCVVLVDNGENITYNSAEEKKKGVMACLLILL